MKPDRKPCTLEPLTDHLVVLRDEAPKVSKGGILLPDVGKQRSTQGEVLAVGPGKPSKKGDVIHSMNFKAGDRIIFSTYAGNEVEHEGKEYLVLRQDDVLAKIEE